MNFANLYMITIISTFLPVLVLFFFMWAYEKDSVLGIWSFGTTVCLIGLVCGPINYTGSELIYRIGDFIYYLGETILLIASFKLIIEKTSSNKVIYNIKKVFLETLAVLFFLIAVTGWQIDVIPIFLGIWYIVATIIMCVHCKQELPDKIMSTVIGTLHGVMVISFNIYPQQDYTNFILGELYDMSCVLLGILVGLIYYHTSRKEVSESLSLADEIMQNTSVILNKVDCEGNIIYSNKGLRTILGYEEDWVKVNQLRNYMHEKDLKQIGKILACLKPERRGAKFQFRLRHHKGYYIWMSMEINPILNKDEVKIGNVVCCKDMTTEKITYVDLMKSQRKFYQLFQGIQDAIFIEPFSTDYVHSRFNQFNKAACENFGYREYDCKGMCLADLDVRFLEDKDTRQGKSCEELIESLLNEEKVVYETEYRTKKGQLIPVEVIDYKFTLNNNDMVMSVVRDISERNIIKEAKALERVKSDFLANVSHELRTPLNVVIITLQSLEIYINDLCLELGREDEKGKRYIDIMKQNALRLLKLVNNFVCMAKIESGFYEASKQNYNIVSLVEDISHSVVTYIEENGITFEFDTDVEEKVVSCDVEMMEKIILNLISNAVKFTPPGGLLFINIKDKGNKVEIKVTDSGIGIPKDKQKIVFERFRQADKTFTRKQEGCGIGLSLVKYFVKQHGGTIDIESEEGLGTSFIIELPAFENEGVPYLEYNFDQESDTLYKRALEFSDIINRKVE